jgi:anti-sigma factor RsiW
MSESIEDEAVQPWDAKATGRISAYLDGELSQDEAGEFEAHLDAEPEVQEHLDQMRRMLGALGSLPDIEAPLDFYEQINRKLRRSKLSSDASWLSSVILPFQVLSIVIILAAAAIFLMTELDRENRINEKELPTVGAPGQLERSAESAAPPGGASGN